MAEQQPEYRSYLLRLWRATDSEGQAVWRASLESTRTRQRQGFASLQSLFEFLHAETEPSNQQTQGE